MESIILDGPILTVKQGKLQGVVEENVLSSNYLSLSHYISFKGIPYAAPPIGKLRFKDPEPPASWDGIRDASKNAGDVCVQMQHFPTQAIIGDEDCLYLNVYIPYNMFRTKQNPVMVWIHGGAYLVGSGNDSDYKPDYLMMKGVILVSINYRLGALGFLNLAHETASGNQGLKDQVAALKWVKENIDTFGGDPNNITVFGVNAGSSSAHLLTLSSLSKDLFHKVILQSGVVTCDWAVIEDQPEATSFKLASILGNDSKDPEEIVEFLQTIPAAEIIKAQFNVLTPEEARVVNIPFGPTIDVKAKKPFLPHSISQLLNDDNNDIPIMIGYTSHECIIFLNDISEKFLGAMYSDLRSTVKKFSKLRDEKKIMQLTERIKELYFHNKPFTKESIPSIIRYLSDIHFDIPIQSFVDNERKRKRAPIYFYKFSYIGNEMTSTRLMGNKLAMSGASHGDDESYIFYKPRYKVYNPEPPVKGTRNRKILEALTTMWTNFAKAGNPTPIIKEHVTTIWLPVTKDSFNYLDINNTLRLLTITDYNNILQET